MKERPILFSGPMVQAILDGRKTQTRRMLKKQPGKFVHIEYDEIKGWQYWWDVACGMSDVRQEYAPLKCPYGAPGDRLWVRESCYIAPPMWGRPVDCNWKDVGGNPRMVSWSDSTGEAERDYKIKKTPSIFMPRWASRITLEITEIRVQRLRDITEEDAKAEGVVPADCCHAHYHGFSKLWESINGPGSWAANPWVWCLSFKRVNP